MEWAWNDYGNFFPSFPPQGADTNLRCRWTNMNALHYATFFDVPEIVQVLAEQNPGTYM